MGLSSMDYWRLAGSLSVVNSAILITGNDPSNKYDPKDAAGGWSDFDPPNRCPPNWVQDTSYNGFDATFEALKGAILTNELSAAVAFPVTEENTSDRDEHSGLSLTALVGEGSKLFELRGLRFPQKGALFFLQKEPNWKNTKIKVPDLKSWLHSKGIFPDFFFPKGDPDSFMNKEHSRYSPKLACAVAAWRKIEAPTRSKTPKQTIKDWVNSNGVNYGLKNEDGIVPAAATEEIATVVNWQTKGGVARTGGVVDDTSEVEAPSEPQNYDEV